MSAARNQHFVPRLHLKRFTCNGVQIHVFDKVLGKSFTSSIVNVASGEYFYNLPTKNYAGFDPFLVDNVLTELEPKYEKAIIELIATVESGRQIHKSQKENLATHLALQILRTREFRESYIEFSTKVLKDLSEAYLRQQNMDAEVQVDINKAEVPAHHAKMLLNPDLLGTLIPFIVDCIWVAGINKTVQPLYTSDNPIVKNPHLARMGQDYTGWLSSGVEIVFPLSSKLILSLYGRRLFQYLDRHVIEGMDGNATILEPDNVVYFNSLQVLHSYRQVYCESNSFDLAKKICDDNPRICNPSRGRWERLS